MLREVDRLSRANPDVYPYVNDDNLLVQFCSKRMREITTLIGEELEPSIFLGSVRYISHMCVSTMFVGIGYSVNPPKVTAFETELRDNTVFGLARAAAAVSGNFEWNGSPINTHSNKSSSYNFNFMRKQFNSQRWTDKEDVWNTTGYQYYPCTKLLKGGAVAYFQIVAYKELPSDGFNTYNDFFNWVSSSSNYVVNTLEQYQNNKETYPNIFSIEMRIFCGATLGQTRNVETWLFYPQQMKATGETLSMWNGSGFSQEYQEGDPLEGQMMEYGVTPQGARVYNYLPTPYIFRGFFNRAITTTSIVNNTNTSWTIRFGLRGYDLQYVTIGGEANAAFIVFSNYDPDDLLDLATDLGFAVTDQNAYVAQNGNINTHEHIWTPTYNSDGDTDGKTNSQTEKEKYTQGGQNGEPIQPNFDPYSGGDEEESYPDDNPSEDQKTDVIDLPTTTLNSYGVFNRSYVMNKNNAQALSDYLWNADGTTFDTILTDLQLVGDNRMNSIISMIMFPFEIPHDDGLHQVRVGRHNCIGVIGRYLDTTNMVFDMGSCMCYAKYQNFLDYEPYTQSWLYIPFCGLFKVPSQQFMNKYIHVKLAVDVLTGAGQAVIYADGIPILYRNCKIGMQIPVTGADSTYTIKNYLEAIENGFGAVSAAASGNAFGAIKGLAGEAVAMISSQNAPVESVGSASPQCGILMPNKAYFIVERPRSLIKNVPDYGKLIGFACYKSGVINEFRGFSKFENVKLDFTNANDYEKAEIRRLLREGVYL